MKTTVLKILIGTTALGLLLPATAPAKAIAKNIQPQPILQSAAYTAQDGTLVTLSGTAVDPNLETFRLDYGGGSILVEMDDFDYWPEALTLTNGQKVQVTGYIDDDFAELRTVKATTVYIKNLNMHLFDKSVDQEKSSYHNSVNHDFDAGSISMTGMVTETRPFHDEMDVAFGGLNMQVDTDNLNYDVYGATGPQQIVAGDRVRIYGELDEGIFERDEISASAVVKLAN